MVSTCYDTRTMFTDPSIDPWLIYTDIYQRYQFRYPASWTLLRQEKEVHLKFERGQDHASPIAPRDICRMVVYKPEPFHELIDLEEYLEFKDRQLGFQYAISRSALADLLPGYRGIREVVSQANEKVHSNIYISYQERMIPISATTREGLELDIHLARTVRFL